MPRPIPADIPAVEPAPLATGEFLSDGLKLTYEVHGESGPWMIFHPGVGFPRVYFRPLAGMLRNHFRCLLLDPRGVAESEGPEDDEGYAIEHMARDVRALVDHLDVDRVHLFGHSLGSNVMLEVAINFPEVVDQLFLISFAAYTKGVQPFLDWVRAGATPKQDVLIASHEAAGPTLSDDGIDDDYGQACGLVWAPHVLHGRLEPRILWSMGQWERPAGALWGRDSAMFVTGLMTRIDQRHDLSRLRCPTHLFYGAYDQYAAPTVPLARQFVPRLTTSMLAVSNHHGHVEEPGRVAEVVLRKTGAVEADALALRADVQVVEQEDGSLVLDDLFTSRSLPLDELEAGILEHFGHPLEAIVERVLADLGDGYEEAQVGEAVADFAASLSAMAMLDEGRDGLEVEALQSTVARELLETERWHELRGAVEQAITEVAFHRERFKENRLTISAAMSPDAYRKVPVMTKAELRANFPGKLVPDGVDVAELLAGGDLSINSTSGSSDERLQVLFDYRVGRLPDAYRRLWHVHDTVDIERGAVFTSPICAGFECHLGKLTMEERLRDSTLTLNSCDDPMAITDEEVRAIASEMNTFEPDTLFTNPWYAVCLLKRVAALGLSLPPLRAVLSSYQFLTMRHRKLMEEGFGTRVFSYYGATDLGGSLIGTECYRGNMHVRCDHVHVELTPPAPPSKVFGDLGMVTVTTLKSPMMPLLRYEVGDLARPAPACDCEGGLGWPCIELEGRLKDVVVRPHDGQALTTKRVDDAIGAADLDFYRLSQDDEVFTLEYVGADGGDVERVGPRLRRLLGPGARLELEEVEAFAPERSLKFRQTSSRSPGVPGGW